MNLSGNPIDFLLAFFAGCLVSFTPCVYPLIPVSVAYILPNSLGSKLKGFTLSLTFVTGIAITYSILGLIASLTGRLFGRISSHPLSVIFTGVVIFLFGLFMLDTFRFSLPNFIKIPKIKQGNYFSTFFLGLVSGLIIGPCVTPVLAAILTYIAHKRNIIYGSLLLFSFAFGMGALIILSGTFGGLLSNLPKAGRWMIFCKRLTGTILLTIGAYFIIVGIRRI